MLPQTERYLALVHLGRNQWWRYALGAVVILFCWLALGYLPYLWLAVTYPSDPLRDYIAVNFSIVMMLVGLALTMRLLHRRPFMSLVGPDRGFAWLRIAQGAAAWSGIALVTIIIEHLLYPDRYYLSFNADRFFLFAAVALVMTPIQTTTEELVFRGYLMQSLALLMRRPALIAALSALIFTLPHLLNPEVQHGPLLLAASYFAIGLLLAVVTLRDGRLELAIGVHAANNLMLALVANYEGSVLTSDSIFTARELDPVYSLISLSAGAVVFYWMFFARKNPAS
ncbi:MAG: CPBP family intramembrane metalloprotease [Betaproteobacteria bacterium]|nr:CPBP family intramembrane metalloprotease [Betaproteobacteria bacterium]